MAARFTDGLQIAAGVLAALGILAGSALVTGVLLLPLVGIVPFVALLAVGISAWSKRKENPSPFLTGLLIGACTGLLVCVTCDVYVFGGYMKW